jgi:magnesium-transporting ATPase (P-type)
MWIGRCAPTCSRSGPTRPAIGGSPPGSASHREPLQRRAATRSSPLSEASPDAPWHALDADDAVARLETHARQGLSDDEAKRRLERYGPNRLPEEARESAFIRFIKQFHNVLIYVLLFAAVLTAILGEWIDTGVIIAVVVVNAVIGFVQEGKAEQALEGIRRMLSLEADVIRDGHRKRISAEELVLGDVVLLEGGDRVPADLRLTAARNGRIEEAALTGESVPVGKTLEAVTEDTLLGDRRNMAFSSTLVTAGQLRGVVVATGERTEIGKIGEMVSGVQRITTPLLARIDRLGRQLSVAILGLAALLFVFGWFARDYTLAELFLIVVSFAVASIPEGLPAIMTITLALGVQRMARRNAVIRRLPAVETLGSVTVICSDKTGTLTRNEMTAARVLTAGQSYEITGAGYETDGEFMLNGEPVDPADDPLIIETARSGLLCNDAELSAADGDAERRLQGDPTDGALVVLAEKAGLHRDAEFNAFPRLDEIPFESENRFMATLHADEKDGRRIFIKGAPERVLDMCSRVRTADGDTDIDYDDWRRRIDEAAADGHRMLAIAMKPGNAGQDRLEPEHVASGCTLLAVAGLIDPPRREAIDAVESCRRAGIRVKMITGDHALTARSIGAQMGIGDGSSVVSGADIEAAGDEELVRIAAENDVFARSSPEHKLRLVRALQARGEVAAMTGDGVNDAPALKQADIGVAMGIKGSEASKSAAEMVLADDNFATIAHAVEEGRTVYDNLKKTILFILPTNGAEALMVVSAVAFAFAELPITPVQILWVNMITAVTLALALAFEPAEPGLMERPPRAPEDPIISGYLLWRIVFVAVIVAAAALYLFLRELDAGRPPEAARTLAVNTLVAGQVFYLFNARYIHARSLSLRRLLANRAALIAGGLLFIFQAAFTYVPIFQTWFGTAAMTAEDWLWATAAGALVFAVVEFEKALLRRRKARRARRRTPAREPGLGGRP